MDENFKSFLKFHHVNVSECSGFASTGALLTPWSLQVRPPLAQYHGVTSPLVANSVSKMEDLVRSASEAHGHTIQLLEA